MGLLILAVETGFCLVVVGTSSAPAGASTPTCSAAHTFVWASTDGNGTAGTTYYVIEISNVGSSSCTLHGYARVWAVSQAGALVGRPATNSAASPAPSLVTLAPDATAHVMLGVVDTGALCGTHGVTSFGLRVVPPGQTLAPSPGERDEVDSFPLEVCSNESSMHVSPVRTGTGIPLYSTS